MTPAGHGGPGRVSRLPRRFYKAVGTERRGTSVVVLLDGKPARTPGKSELALPGERLAGAVAAEWSGQAERIDPATMPLTRLANTVIDGVARRAEEVAADIAGYAGSDLLCYRAEHPGELVAEQAAAWGPVLDWAGEVLAIRLSVASGVMHMRQPAAALAAARAAVDRLDPWRLGAVHVMTTLTGSLLLALAVELGRLTAEEAWSAAHIDEDFQIRQWGADAEAAARRQARWTDMATAARLLELMA